MAEPGTLLADRYRLEEVIGRGGMATVYRAWDTRLDRAVAVKLLRAEILEDPDLALRFRREGHAAAVLRHPNVVACLEAGNDGEHPYLVMELVDGEDLASRLRREAPLPELTATRLAADVARGLAVAHARGIVHRDVKPGNILVDRAGRARITDFGVARIAAESDATIAGTTLGSVHYFSPEQARGIPTIPASDVYSLGLVLFEMLTGTRPFGGETPAAVALARVDASAPSPRAVLPALSAQIDAVVRRALAPDPADRFANGGALADALESCLPLPAPAVDPSSTTARFESPLRPPAGSAPAPRAAIAAPVLGLVAAIVVAALAFGALTLFGGRSDDPPAVAEAASGDPSPATTEPAEVPASQPPVTEPPVTEPPATEPPVTEPPAPADPGDLCRPDPEGTCALAAGSYTPSGFEPPVAIELGEGWATFRAGEELIVLARDEGYLTLASGVTRVFDGEDEFEVRPRANDLLDALRDNDAVEILDQRRTRVDGHRAVELDLVPVGERTPLFGAGDDVFYAEAGTVTRVTVFEVRGTPVILTLEGANGADLDAFLDAAGSALSSLTLG